MRQIKFLVLFIITFILTSHTSKADLVYTFDDNFTGSQFGGFFAFNPNLLQDYSGPGKLLTTSALTNSYFQYGRASFGNIAVFRAVSVDGGSLGGIAIDPNTGAVLSSGWILTGPSAVVPVGSMSYQVLGARLQLDTNYNVRGPSGMFSSQSALVRDKTNNFEYLMSSGYWRVAGITPVPAPAGFPLALVGVLFLRRQWKSSK
jgi:hypothetical protein